MSDTRKAPVQRYMTRAEHRATRRVKRVKNQGRRRSVRLRLALAVKRGTWNELRV